MAIYHLSMKILSRSDGKSAVAAAAYRAGEKLKDERSGQLHDYTRKRNVITSALILSDGVTRKVTRSELWNGAEAAEKRKNSCIAREIEVALPVELPLEARIGLAKRYAQDIAERYCVAADVAVHAPDRKGDERNIHAHILMTTRRIAPDGQLTDKARELDDYKTRTAELDYIRTHWAAVCNQELERYGIAERVDHRTLSAQGIDRAPQIHVGVHATQMERRGIETERGEQNRQRQRINNGLETIERTIRKGERDNKKQTDTPTQKPAEAPKSPEAEKYTQEQISAAKRALNTASQRYGSQMKEQLDADVKKRLAPLYKQEEAKIQERDALQEAEPKKQIFEWQLTYEKRWRHWRDALNAVLTALGKVQDKINEIQSRRNEAERRIPSKAEELARKEHPRAARIVDWEKQRKERRLQERLKERRKEREENQLGGWER